MINRQNFLIIFVMVALTAVVAWTFDVWPFSSLKADQSEARSLQGAEGAALSPNSEVAETVLSGGPAKNLPSNTPISTFAAGNANGLRSIQAHPSKPRESSLHGADPSRVRNFLKKESRDYYPQSSISDGGAKAYTSTMGATAAAISDAKSSATTEIPSARSMDVTVEAPSGDEAPSVPMPVEEADGFTSEDLATVNAEADKSTVETAQESTVTLLDQSRRQSSQQKSNDQKSEVPSAQSMDVTVEVPDGEEVPLVLVPVDETDGFTPEDLAIINAEADKFVVETSQEGTVTQPDPSRWQSSQQKSDELFRTWYGNEAYMAMQERRYFESRLPNNP